MRTLRKFFVRCISFFHKRSNAARLREELAHHMELATEDFIKSGLSREEASRQSILEFGSLESVKDSWRDQASLPLLENFWRDIRQGSRSLRLAPSFSSFTILAYAIGIGAATLTFTVFDNVLLKPFSFHQPDRLLTLYGKSIQSEGPAMLSFPEFRDIRSLTEIFSQVGAMLPAKFDTTGGLYPERFLGRIVTDDFFPSFGIQPFLGRAFTKNDSNTVLLSQATWATRFGSDPNILGSKLNLRWNDQAARAYTVIGVLPNSIQTAFPRHTELWAQLDEAQPDFANRRAGAFDVTVRLRDNVSLGQARAALDSLAKSLATQYPERPLSSILAVPLHDELTEAPSKLFPVIVAAVGFLLALACANIANLALARGNFRLRELKIRASLGASRARLVRQLLTESMLLACTGGLIGVTLAWSLLKVTRALIPDGFLRGDAIVIDTRVLLAALAITILTGIVTGLWPALRLSALSFTGRPRSAPYLVIAEIAISLVLLSAAALSLHSLYRVLTVNTGFDTANLIAMQTNLPRENYRDPIRRAQTIEQILQSVGSISGVGSATVSDFRPLGSTMNLRIQSSEMQELAVTTESIFGQYFESLRVPLLAGRGFQQADSPDSPKVAIISRRAAELLWPSGQALGKNFQTIREKPETYLVVGIAGDVRRAGPTREAKPHFYTSTNQEPPYLVEILVRSRPGVEASSLLHSIRLAAASIDGALGIHEAVLLDDSLQRLLKQPRWIAALLGSFGALALLLTAIGIYGSTSYFVSQKRYEIGVRMAVGATQGQIRNQFLYRGLAHAFLGIGLGTIGIFWLGHFLKGMLYGLEPLDPTTNLFAVGALLLIALAANYFPARQAARQDPSSTLRCD